ncbi:hypothetical protein ES708_28819 [subsurface metagenome]
MLKYMTKDVKISVAGEEVLVDIIGGMAGKNRIIKSIGSPTKTELWLRAYRDAEQVVDVYVTLFTDSFTLLPIDISLAEGQLFTAGFKDDLTSFAEATYKLVIGYEEAG